MTYIQKHHIGNAMIFADISIDTVNETYSTNHETFQMLDMLEGWSQTSNTMTDRGKFVRIFLVGMAQLSTDKNCWKLE